MQLILRTHTPRFIYVGKRMLLACVVVFLSLWGFAGKIAHAQITTATLVGTVSDSTGAAVPRAKVTVKNTATGFVRSINTAGDGTYRVEFLPIGDYTISVGALGFKTATEPKVTLNLNAEVRLGRFRRQRC